MSDNDQAPGAPRATSGAAALDPNAHRSPLPEVPSVVVDDVSLTFRSQVSSGGRGGLRGLTSMMRTSKYVEVHALKNVSFVAGEGEAIGLVGRNGSGKSTLLRVIAGLLPPTSGRVWTESEPNLLGVSSVLVPQLSGERNIRLGGLAMGLTPEEVEESLPDVAAFTGIGQAVRMPMNTYSSGMAARLRFAISTQRTPRILMVDEALATGDEDFRKRSEKRIAEMRAETGTIFLVSHSLSTVRETCDRALWLDRGELQADGPPNEVCALYLDAVARGT